jgi:voltage-gated potassium channel
MGDAALLTRANCEAHGVNMTKSLSVGTARAELSRRIEHWFDVPLALLGAVWLLLLVAEFVYGATPLIETGTTTIWIVFVLEFAIRFIVAPRRGWFLRRNWLTALSLALPAIRILRFARAVRLLRLGRGVRALRMARLLTSFNRGMRALGSTMRTRGFPYVLALTVVVLSLGAAGMFAFERDQGNQVGFSTFGAALWWTAMLLTTMGSEYWPRSSEGRVICLLLSIYAFAMFGYITATLASFFVGSDVAEERRRSRNLEEELSALRAQVERLATGR